MTETAHVLQISEEDLERELQHEQGMIDRGAQAYWSKVEAKKAKGDAAATKGGTFLLKTLIDPVAARIDAFCNKGGVGKRSEVVPYLKALRPEVAAYVTLRVILNVLAHRGTGDSLTHLAQTVGQHIEDELFAAHHYKDKGAFYNAVKTSLDQRTSSYSHRRRVMKRAMTREGGQVWDEWPSALVLKVGLKLTAIVEEETGIIKTAKAAHSTRKKRQVFSVTLTEEANKLIDDANELGSMLSPMLMPTLIPPKPWTSPMGGGYWSPGINLRLVKNFSRGFLTAVKDHEMPQVYSAINLIQSTAFRISTDVLEVAQHIFDNGLQIAGLPTRDPTPIPPKPVNIEEDEEVRREWRTAAHDAYEANAVLRSKRVAIAKCFLMAETMKDEPEIYFPAFFDFRGRVYFYPVFLNPQGADYAKGLLEFAEAKPLGERGGFWLGVHLANCWGNDKVPLEERFAWAEAHSDEIIHAAENPLEGYWWAEADEPFQFLQACKAWKGWVEEGPAHMSHICVRVDGSCNGLQHLSALLRDEVGGAAVNLVPADKPNDIYSQVASKVIERLEEDDSPLAAKWLPLIDRKVCKRPVMTLPYGAKPHGYTTQILDDTVKPLVAEKGNVFDPEKPFFASQYLAGHLWEASGGVVRAAQEAMAWLKESARVVAKEDAPITWITPVGFPVVQNYHRTETVAVISMLHGKVIRPSYHKALAKVDKQRSANGVAPNFIHSLDAAHLCLVANEVHYEIPEVQLWVVHDSYGSHACDMDALGEQIRKTFVQMHSQDLLGSFRDDIAANCTEATIEDFPPLPRMGTLELNKVLESTFFFA